MILDDVVKERPFLMRCAMRLTKNLADAEDLVQETTVKIMMRPGLFDGKNFRGWARVVMYRKFLDSLPRPLLEDGRPAPDAGETCPAGEYGGLSDEIRGALAGLCESQRRVLLLHALYGYTADEIAQLMGTSRGTVHQHLHRARRKMAERLRG